MNYTIRRILLMVPTLLLASIIVAAMVRLLPGDTIDIMTQGTIRGESKEFAKLKLGLDRAFHVQYIRWILGWPKTESKIYRTTDGGETWRRLASDTIEPLRSTYFLTSTAGWGLGEKVIFGTTDGGRVWTNQHKDNQNLNAIFFVDEKNGWVVGDKGTLFHTSEGGIRRLEADVSLTSWFTQDSGTRESLSDIVFVDLDHGWAVGNKGTILHTNNGGVSWTPQITNDQNHLAAVAFTDSGLGMAVGNKGTILRTGNGGQTWSRVESD
ncbi:MAG: YCF48-related protein, partial [Dehalococcoidia bacterium]